MNLQFFLKNICRSVASLALTLLIPFFSATAAYAAQPEQDLISQLQDIEALIEAGISFNEYSKQTTSMILLSARCKRSKKCDGGKLQAAVDSLLEAKDLWADMIEEAGGDSEKMKALKAQQLQSKWRIAFIFLEEHMEDNKRKKK